MNKTNQIQIAPTREKVVSVHNGWVTLVVIILLYLGTVGLLIYSIAAGQRGGPLLWPFLASMLLLPFDIIMTMGFFTLQPNEARVLILFGEYKGTVRESGFHWGNPFYSNGPRTAMAAQAAEPVGKPGGSRAVAAAQWKRHMGRYKISLRARTHNIERLKVNDKRGNPIEIGAVVVWRVQDTAQATFDVDDYENYIEMQSESALRHLASSYAYDHGEENEITLRSNVEEVSVALRTELQERLIKAGVTVDEARLTHLAYAPEIAQAMLRRQQAEAVIGARKKIVFGAVSMVEMALKEMTERKVLDLDDERKASMVSNLMVVLCGESEVHPVINTGTLYS
ncbi:MAG: SPFH domain-containing protein [Verrucomicrobiota bacterium]|nr:SPFH domain-containing protein [Verrucomicrobiota bacterium]